MSLGTMEQRTEGMKRQAKELIEQAYQRGYKAGVESCADAIGQISDDAKNDGITEGRDEAWELAYKLVFNQGNIRDVFDSKSLGSIVEEYSVTEAIEKIREWEEKQTQEEDNEIHVGDEVKNQYGFKYFITGINDNLCCGIGGTGYYQNDIRLVKKTGRSIPEIAEVLKKIQEGE